MANTVYGPYTPTSWVTNVTGGSQSNMNNLESQSKIALHGLNSDLFTAFVAYGMVCTKDGTTVNQLDVTAGRAYLTMTDGTLGLIITAASTPSQFTTSAASSTYHLYLQPDGTWYWSTSNSPESNSLYICSVATDGSGNISSVTDQRALNTTLLASMAGTLDFGSPSTGGLAIGQMGTTTAYGVAAPGASSAALAAGTNLGTGVYKYVVSYVGPLGESAAGSLVSITTTTGNQAVNLSSIPTGPTGVQQRNIYRTAVGGSTYKLLATLNDNVTTTYSDTTADGSLGSQNPVTHPTMGGSFWKTNGGTLVAGIYADGAVYFDSGHITSDGSGDLTATAYIFGAGVSGSKSSIAWDGTNHQNVFWTPQSGATALGHLFVTWNGSAQVDAFSIGGQFGSALAWVDNSGNYNGGVSAGIPTTRLVSSTWTAYCVPIYTGASAPTATQSPPTGSIFIEA